MHGLSEDEPREAARLAADAGQEMVLEQQRWCAEAMVSADYGLGRHRESVEHGRVCMCVASPQMLQQSTAKGCRITKPHLQAVWWQLCMQRSSGFAYFRVTATCISAKWWPGCSHGVALRMLSVVLGAVRSVADNVRLYRAKLRVPEKYHGQAVLICPLVQLLWHHAQLPSAGKRTSNVVGVIEQHTC